MSRTGFNFNFATSLDHREPMQEFITRHTMQNEGKLKRLSRIGRRNSD